jgi:hypothetical protein
MYTFLKNFFSCFTVKIATVSIPSLPEIVNDVKDELKIKIFVPTDIIESVIEDVTKFEEVVLHTVETITKTESEMFPNKKFNDSIKNEILKSL